MVESIEVPQSSSPEWIQYERWKRACSEYISEDCFEADANAVREITSVACITQESKLYSYGVGEAGGLDDSVLQMMKLQNLGLD